MPEKTGTEVAAAMKRHDADEAASGVRLLTDFDKVLRQWREDAAKAIMENVRSATEQDGI